MKIAKKLDWKGLKQSVTVMPIRQQALFIVMPGRTTGTPPPSFSAPCMLLRLFLLFQLMHTFTLVLNLCSKVFLSINVN
jgi:hypothetical protein